jgi:hypothetical protein
MRISSIYLCIRTGPEKQTEAATSHTQNSQCMRVNGSSFQDILARLEKGDDMSRLSRQETRNFNDKLRSENGGLTKDDIDFLKRNMPHILKVLQRQPIIARHDSRTWLFYLH